MTTLGPCCCCGTSRGVRNIVMLDRKSPIPGHGWGCVVCELAPDGASYVCCDACCEANRSPVYACRGYPGTDGRVYVGELRGEHHHDEARHAAEEDWTGGLPAIPGADPWERLS